jgi:hypothetical protein
MNMRHITLLSWFVVAGLTNAVSMANPFDTQPAEPSCSCGEEPGIVWNGDEPISLLEIAELAAPILWFSPDEPLLKREDAIPMAHPCDTPASNAVVYYQVAELVYRDNKVTLPPEEDPRFFEKVDHMVLKYFFYYPEDIGLGAHTHDLEVVEMEIGLDKLRGCYQVRIVTVNAQAHDHLRRRR